MAYIYPASFGVTDDTNEDNNHCALRAYCNVTGESFKDAQIIFAKQGRKHKQGTQVKVLHGIYTQAGMKALTMGSSTLSEYVKTTFNTSSNAKARTIKSMLNTNEYKKGKYIFVSRGHAFSVIDGKIIDTLYVKESTRIYIVYTYEQV